MGNNTKGRNRNKQKERLSRFLVNFETVKWSHRRVVDFRVSLSSASHLNARADPHPNTWNIFQQFRIGEVHRISFE